MDVIIKRFPFLNYMVLKNLDDQSLMKSKQANRKIARFLENERFYMIRILKKYSKNYEGLEESWKEVIYRAPINVIKQLAIATNNFSIFFGAMK